MTENQYEEEFGKAYEEVSEMIRKNQDGMKLTFIQFAEDRAMSKDEALKEASELYLLVKIRSELEEDSCSLKDYAMHLKKCGKLNLEVITYYKKYLERIDHISSLFKEYKRDELYGIFKELGVKGCSKYRKNEFLEQLDVVLLDEEQMKRSLSVTQMKRLNYLNVLCKKAFMN